MNSKKDWEQLLQFDREHIWHPYTSMLDPLPVYPVVEARGVRLKLADGRELIDGMASWWAVIHGYNHPLLNEALESQLKKMAHVMFGGLTHQPAVELANLLIQIVPKPLQKVFFSDSGSVSVEVALKMALQYWQAKGKTRKAKFLSLAKGYHGDTFGAMSVCDPITGMHKLFTHFLPKNFFVSAPECSFDASWDEKYIAEFKTLLQKHHEEIAAVILEPIVQGAGGMRFYAPQYLLRVRELCTQYQVLLIADEIATGFGRTGKLFACEHSQICPDIMCLGKALTGGYMTLAATLCTDKVAETISGVEPGVFMHGPTFMANPLACSVARASVRLLLNSVWQDKIMSIEKQLKKELAPCQDLPAVKEVRVLGGIGVVEVKENIDVAWMQKEFVRLGVWIRPFLNLIYIMPPYIISTDEISRLTQAIFSVVRKVNAKSS